jgi:hypothetical protein
MMILEINALITINHMIILEINVLIMIDHNDYFRD